MLICKFMKLIYITSSRIPTEKAHGYQICKMCEEFSSLGIEVKLFIPARHNNIKEDAFAFYKLKNNFEIIKIKSFDFLRYGKYLGRLGFWLHSLAFAFKLLFKNFNKNAIIYSREPEICWLFNLKGYKTIFESHNWPKKDKLFKSLVKDNNRVIVITHGLKKLFLENNWPAGKILVAPDGVDLNEFDIDLAKESARKILKLPGKKIVLYTGHLYEWKGASDLAQATVFLGADCLTVFVGGTEDDVQIFKKKNKALLAEGKIAVHGHVRHHLIPVWLKAADVLVLPNKSRDDISKFYTSPLKLFEYMASKRPIVATDLPSLREILNEHNCVFCRPNDPEDLATKIRLVLNSSSLEKVYQQAYVDVQKYTWQKRAEKIIEFIT